MEDKYYLRIGKASDLQDLRERQIYRFFEILPGALAWLTLILVVFLSWQRPIWIAIFIILFDTFWLLKTIYLTLHTYSAYKKMEENIKKDWLTCLKMECQFDWQNIYHLIIFPMYKEPLEIVRTTFQALITTDYPKNKFIVVLATEEAAGEEFYNQAKIIEQEFGKSFFRFLITKHPKNLPGEIAGKGANETWAARKAKELIIDPLKIPYQNIIVSSLDVDTIVYPKYFSCLTYHYLTSKNPLRTSFQPIPLFINNIWEAPVISRVIAFSTTFWQIMNQERPERQITFSSHSLPFQALIDINFWQTNVVSEDSRIFWQCFLFYDGDYQVQSLYYPITMDANVAKTFWRTLANLYRQQRRWAYGTADISYWLFGFLKNKKIPFKRKWQYGFFNFEGFYSWATSPLLIFLLGWLPLILGGAKFNITLLAYNLPRFTQGLMIIAMVGIVFLAILAINLLPPRRPQYGRWKYLIMAFQWLLLPVTFIIFGALPCLDSQTRLMLGKYLGFWPTEKIRKS